MKGKWDWVYWVILVLMLLGMAALVVFVRVLPEMRARDAAVVSGPQGAVGTSGESRATEAKPGSGSSEPAPSVKTSSGTALIESVEELVARAVPRLRELLAKSPQERAKEIVQLDYEDAFRHNEAWIGKLVRFRGQVFHVSESVVEGTSTFTLQVFVDGSYKKDLLVLSMGKRFLKGDEVEVVGLMLGLIRLQTVLGGIRTTPVVMALHVGLVRK